MYIYINIKECCVPSSKTTPHVSIANVVSSECDDSVEEGIHNDNVPLSIPRVQIIKHALPKRSSYTTYRDSEDMTNSACSLGNYDNNNTSSYSKLYLTGTLFFNKQLIITNKGLMKSLRKKNDSHVFFGMNNAKDCTGTSYNDFIINTTELTCVNVNESENGRVFEISYNMKDNNYTLIVKHPHINIMYSIEHFFFFNHDAIYHVLFGHVLVQFTTFFKDRSLLLQIRIDNTTTTTTSNEVYTISSYNTPIIIGRDNCDVSLHHKSVSKKHCTVMYSKIERKYYLKDEDSSNGLVLVLKENESIDLKGNMTFRIERSKFKIWEMP